LGDTSVHAFTDLGMNAQLLGFLLIFVIPYFALFLFRYKTMMAPPKEDEIKSREFWMLVGSLILFLSAVVIIAITSIPVFNKLFGTKIAPPEDAAFAHNQVQVFVAIIIGLLTAVGQYLKFKGTTGDYFKQKIKLPLLISLVVSVIVYVFVGVKYDEKGIGFTGAIYVALFAAIFTVIANLQYFISVQKGKLKSAGASIGHIGFGMVLVGILISSSNKTVLSWNTTGISPLRMESNKNPAGNPKENITLFEGIATDMGKYMVTYVRDTFDLLDKRFFELNFKEKETNKEFLLYPDVLKNNKGMEGFSANPSSKHYWNKDIFVYVTSFQDHTKNDTASFVPHQMSIGDSIFYGNGYMKLEKVLINPNPDKPAGTNELVLQLAVTSKEGLKYQANPSITLQGMTLQAKFDTVKAQNIVLSFNKVVDQKKGILEIGVKESASLSNLITLKAYEFPFINILWIGVIVMVIGFGIATMNRVKKLKAK
jgi:cytochrome c-type biogenesis protein CcmF